LMKEYDRGRSHSRLADEYGIKTFGYFTLVHYLNNMNTLTFYQRHHLLPILEAF